MIVDKPIKYKFAKHSMTAGRDVLTITKLRKYFTMDCFDNEEQNACKFVPSMLK